MIPALTGLPYYRDTVPAFAEMARYRLGQVLADVYRSVCLSRSRVTASGTRLDATGGQRTSYARVTVCVTELPLLSVSSPAA